MKGLSSDVVSTSRPSKPHFSFALFAGRTLACRGPETEAGTSVHGGPVKSEQGFTLIELLVTCAIITILAGLAIAAFTVYRDSAELAKGVSALKNARTALGAGELEFTDGFSLPFTQSSTAGGPMSGPLASVLPGNNLSAGVRLSVEINSCDESSGPFDRSQYIVAEPCKSQYQARWQRFCGGTEVQLERVANPSPCA